MAEKKSEAKSASTIPLLPKSYEHRASMKWITIESLRVAQERLNHAKHSPVVLFTSAGMIEGELTDIAPTFAESYQLEMGEELIPNITSMVANLRIELLRMMEQSEKKLEIIDSAPLIGLKNVKIHASEQVISMPELTLFADQIIGFSIPNQQSH